VFNTAMTGYQEILTDPSYAGQIVTMTAPHVGNYGINDEDMESDRQHLGGFVVREVARRYSNHRAERGLADYLESAGTVGLCGIDTRALTRRLRAGGAMRGVISTEIEDPCELVAQARASEPIVGRDLVGAVPPDSAVAAAAEMQEAHSAKRVVLINCGVKRNIIRLLAANGCATTVAPAHIQASEILDMQPHGILISNGPGDPAAVQGTTRMVRALLGKVPIFGICMGCQISALALGAETYKMKFGHHGANHPVLDVARERVEITSQNHGFAVAEESLLAAGGRVTHRSLYDGSVEGFTHEALRVQAVQYHPEAAPGPHDSRYLFERFIEHIRC
jgi:carbamoyl-phosphate synthase small subunit